MKIASTVSRYLLGLLFAVFGSNGFLHFINPPPPSTAYGLQFLTVAAQSHFLAIIFLAQLLAGIALLAGRFVPLALIVLAAVLVNVLDYHLTMDPAGIAPGLVATALWFVTAAGYRESFRWLFVMNATPVPAARGDYSPLSAG